MDGQLAKPSAERLVLLKVQFLVPEEQHLMLHQRVVNFLERLVAQFLPEIDTVDFRADGRRDRADLDISVPRLSRPFYP